MAFSPHRQYIVLPRYPKTHEFQQFLQNACHSLVLTVELCFCRISFVYQFIIIIFTANNYSWSANNFILYFLIPENSQGEWRLWPHFTITLFVNIFLHISIMLGSTVTLIISIPSSFFRTHFSETSASFCSHSSGVLIFTSGSQLFLRSMKTKTDSNFVQPSGCLLYVLHVAQPPGWYWKLSEKY